MDNARSAKLTSSFSPFLKTDYLFEIHHCLLMEPFTSPLAPGATRLRRLQTGQPEQPDQLEELMGLRENDRTATEPIFISFDLAVACDRERLNHLDEKPVIRQMGFARLDIRNFCSPYFLENPNHFISLRCVQVTGVSLSRKSKTKNKRKAVFATPKNIRQYRVAAEVTQNLQIRDNRCGSGSLRNIVLIGQSIKRDLKILEYLGIDVFNIAPIVAVIDTCFLARFTLPPFDPITPLKPGQDFTLFGVLSQLGCNPDPYEFHNAGNDAVYTLYVLVLLTINHVADRTTELHPEGARALEAVKMIRLPPKK